MVDSPTNLFSKRGEPAASVAVFEEEVRYSSWTAAKTSSPRQLPLSGIVSDQLLGSILYQ